MEDSQDVGKAAIILKHLWTKKELERIPQGVRSGGICPINAFLQFLVCLTLIHRNVPPADMEASCGKRYRRAGCGCGPAWSSKYEAGGDKYLVEG